MRYNLTFFLGAVAALAGPSVGALAEEISVEDLSDLPVAEVVILGEVHDNPEHHLNQAEAIDALQPKAVVFEMLTDAQALKIRPEMVDDATVLSQVLNWENSGWPHFSLYYPIFVATGDTPIFGGAAPKEQVRLAVSDGGATVFGPGASLFGLTQVLDDDVQSAREAGQFAAHCDALPVSMLAGMVQAQRYRDAVLAQAVLAALGEDGVGPVVLITGNGHARHDWGVPAALQIAAPDLTVLSVAQFESQPDDDGDVPFDLWLVTDPTEREDPCLAFQR